MVQINAGNVVCDGMWLWRADHDLEGSVRGRRNACTNGLVVRGADVTAYGLAVEHTLGAGLQWLGERGRVYFFQAEIPYDVDAFRHIFMYTVGDDVSAHDARGVGVYSFFRDFHVDADAGACAPASPGVSFQNVFVVFLSGHGGVSHVLRKGGTYLGDGVRRGHMTAYVLRA